MIPTIEEILVKLANGDMAIDDADHWMRQHISNAEDTGHLRDLYAGLAMHALTLKGQKHLKTIAQDAYEMAEAMMEAREA